MPKPDVYLGVGSMERNRQIKAISAALRETFFQKNRPDIVIVVGDVNSTLAAARATQSFGR